MQRSFQEADLQPCVEEEPEVKRLKTTAKKLSEEEVHGLWVEMCAALEVPSVEAQQWWEKLRSMYQEEGRAYHCWDHVVALLSDMRSFALGRLKDPLLVTLAIFFHDAVYDPRATAGSNEEESAALWNQFSVHTNLPPDRKEMVWDWILCTKDHLNPDIPVDNTDLLHFLDMDLAILQSSEDEYHEYSHNVRIEYQHVPSSVYAQGRGKFLEGMLRKDPIFRTDMYPGGTQRAHHNMRQELTSLRNRGRISIMSRDKGDD